MSPPTAPDTRAPSTPPWAQAAVAIAALAAAFVAGRWSAPGEPPSQPARPAVAAAAHPAAPAPTPPAASAPADGCEGRLAVATALLEAEQKARFGTPVPFPPDLEPQYTAAGFEAAVKEALAACPGTGLELARVDCDEFPCMAWFAQPTGSYNHALDQLRSCAGWTDRFGTSGGSANSHFVTAKGDTEWSMASVVPAGTPLDDNASTRFSARADDGEAALMELWGGREPDALEKVDQEIAFWESVGPDGADALADARARRATLAEAAAAP